MRVTLPNSVLERAHAVSNKYKMDEATHMFLIGLLQEVYDLGRREEAEWHAREHEYCDDDNCCGQ